MRNRFTTLGLRGLIGVAAIGGAVALCTAPAVAQQKTAKQCAEEWRANKADNQARHILERDYVKSCQAGTATQPAAAPAPAGPTPAAAAPAPAAAQKTAKQCAEEWRANKADNQARHILERDYVKSCQAGTVAAQPAAVPAAAAPAPAAAAPAAAPAPAPKTATTPAPAPRETTAVAPAGQFANEAMAKARCASDTVVWANEKSKIYHFSGNRYYGNTKDGTYMCEKAAIAAGIRAAENEKHP